MEDREAPHVLDRLAISPHSSGPRKSGISWMITALSTLLSAEKAFYGWWRQALGFREGFVLRGCLLSAVSWQVNTSDRCVPPRSMGQASGPSTSALLAESPSAWTQSVTCSFGLWSRTARNWQKSSGPRYRSPNLSVPAVGLRRSQDSQAQKARLHLLGFRQAGELGHRSMAVPKPQPYGSHPTSLWQPS